MPADLALRYDPARRRCDLVFTGSGLALDTTARSAMLVSLLAARHARADDPLPDYAPEDPTAPRALNAGGGYPGDALDRNGEQCGSRLHLLRRAKATETTRLRALAMAEECLAWFGRRDLTPTVSAAYAAPTRLQIVARVGATEVSISRPVS